MPEIDAWIWPDLNPTPELGSLLGSGGNRSEQRVFSLVF